MKITIKNWMYQFEGQKYFFADFEQAKMSLINYVIQHKVPIVSVNKYIQELVTELDTNKVLGESK